MKDSVEIRCPDAIWETWRAYQRMSAPNEVQVYGIGTLAETGGLNVIAIDLPEQTVSGGAVESEGAAMAACFARLRAICPDGFVWWLHSHVNMACAWSQTDRDQHAMHARDAGGDPVFATVSNLKGESLSVVALGGLCPVLAPARLVIGEVQVAEEVRELFKARVKTKPVAATRATGFRVSDGARSQIGSFGGWSPTTPSLESAIKYMRRPYQGTGETQARVLADLGSKMRAIPEGWRDFVESAADALCSSYPDTREGCLGLRGAIAKELEEILALETEIDVLDTQGGDTGDLSPQAQEAAEWQAWYDSFQDGGADT